MYNPRMNQEMRSCLDPEGLITVFKRDRNNIRVEDEVAHKVIKNDLGDYQLPAKPPRIETRYMLPKMVSLHHFTFYKRKCFIAGTRIS